MEDSEKSKIKSPEDYGAYDFPDGYKTKDGVVTKRQRAGKDAVHPGSWLFFIQFDEPKGEVDGRWAYGSQIEE